VIGLVFYDREAITNFSSIYINMKVIIVFLLLFLVIVVESFRVMPKIGATSGLKVDILRQQKVELRDLLLDSKAALSSTSSRRYNNVSSKFLLFGIFPMTTISVGAHAAVASAEEALNHLHPPAQFVPDSLAFIILATVLYFIHWKMSMWLTSL
jgi:hypothetical protein